MFLGEYQHTLDAKGRVSLPARFRANLTGKLVVSKGLESCLYVHSEAEYQDFVDRLVAKDDFKASSRKLRRFFLAGSQEVELDSAGRVSISSVLRDFAGLEKDVAVIGNGSRIEIWDAGTWAEYNESAADDVEALAEELANAGML